MMIESASSRRTLAAHLEMAPPLYSEKGSVSDNK
jgi:hypothetical protein